MAAITRARALPMWRSLSVRDFRLLWASEAVSLVGDQFHVVALAWLVIDLTQSGLALGTVLIAIGVPRALLIVPFGVLADRLPARSMMLAAHLVRGVVVGAMAALVMTDSASIPLLAALGVVFGAADAAFIPAQQAFLPRTLEADQLPSGNALLQGTMQLTGILAPPLAGAAIALVGTGAAFVVDSASFFAAAVIVLFITSTGAARAAGSATAAGVPGGAGTPGTAATGADTTSAAPEPGFGAQLREGIAYVLSDPPLRTTLLISLVMNFALNGPAAVGMPWLAEIRFDAGPVGLGLLTAAYALGALVGTVLAGNVRQERQGARILAFLGITGIALLVVGLAPWLGLALAALAVMGLVIGYVNIVAISWLQRRVAPDMVGRVMAITMLMGFGATPLSFALAGWLLDVAPTALFAGATVLVLATTAFAWSTGFAARFDAAAPDVPSTGEDARAA
ncbi:MAG TPA: MFS transporter [Candidatus Limnocylindrales bacterium]|nr:MFS transporter [Candidatus Limnocylindrales bacterium]